MSTIDQITFRKREDSSGLIYPTAATSIRDPGGVNHWQPLLAAWLRSGRPPGRAYLNFGREAALIRWYVAPRSRFDWQYALALVGEPAALTARYAVELPDLDAIALDAAGSPLRFHGEPRGPLREALAARARSPEATGLLVPLLAHALEYQQRRVFVPWRAPGLPEAVMWGLTTILGMIGNPPPVSFLTLTSGPARYGAMPGLLVTFGEDVTEVPPDEGFRRVAANLVAGFAEAPEELQQSLASHGVLEPADYRDRVRRLNQMPDMLPPRRPAAPAAQPPETGAQSTEAITGPLETAAQPQEAAAHLQQISPQPLETISRPLETSTRPLKTVTRPAEPGARDHMPGQVVKCPLCLHRIEDWDAADRWRWDGASGDYVKITLPRDANEDQRSREMHAAYVCCPSSQAGPGAAHYLPASYGRFGDPVLLGFVGLTKSGKTHLLTSMVGKMGDLASRYRISARPLDPVNHQRFLESSVRPLLSQHEVLPGTPEDETTQFADAFIVRHASGPERVVVLFDVAGGDLRRTDTTKQFLWIADGLFFVIDPDHIADSSAGGDQTFTNVLNIVRDRPRAEPVSAAVVVNKADKVRFEEPVARWLRSGDSGLNALDFLRESADVYAYLDREGAAMLADEPYQVCEKATLHVASPTGGIGHGEGKGSSYPRGVTPRRVLRPLVAMLAMTGVLTGPEAEKVGV